MHAAVDRLGRVIHLGFSPPVRAPDGVVQDVNKYACGELEYQLEQYFRGERTEFSVEVRLDGTSFQKAVWSRLQKIGYGQTLTYGEVARKLGRREAARAVGNAVAANPAVILIPCHRVLPAGGGIGNYALRGLDADRGRWIKQLLLDLETASTPVTSPQTAEAN